MIITNLTGGLGNQMFQYAFGRYIANKHDTDLKLHFTNALFNTSRSYMLDVFNITATIALQKDLQNLGVTKSRIVNRFLYILDERCDIQFNSHIVTQKYPYVFNPKYFEMGNNSYIQGFWNNERYFNKIEDLIRREFTSKKKLDNKNLRIFQDIQKTHSVSIHVRRGDYVTNKTNAKLFGFLGLDYYIFAIKKIKKHISNPVFFVFSDDILWCKENLPRLAGKIYFVDHNRGKEDYKDLLLMSACNHNIIANSSFSWWVSWLNRRKDKIVIKP